MGARFIALGRRTIQRGRRRAATIDMMITDLLEYTRTRPGKGIEVVPKLDDFAKGDLQRWRETYPEALRANGIEATATRRLQRLKLERGERQAVRQIRDSGRELKHIGQHRGDPKRAQQHAIQLEGIAIEAYRRLCGALGQSDDVEARRLAVSVMNRLADDRGNASPAKRAERAAKRTRDEPQK